MTAGAAAHVCMYVCAAMGAQVVEEQEDKPNEATGVQRPCRFCFVYRKRSKLKDKI